jgi:hypothetical protein
MTKLEIQAIQRLPRRYVHDGTSVTTVYIHKAPSINTVVAINPALPVIHFIPNLKSWRKVKWRQLAKTPNCPGVDPARPVFVPIIP